MSKEAASKFVQAILDDEELRKRTEKMKPEDAVPLGDFSKIHATIIKWPVFLVKSSVKTRL